MQIALAKWSFLPQEKTLLEIYALSLSISFCNHPCVIPGFVVNILDYKESNSHRIGICGSVVCVCVCESNRRKQ